MGYVTSELINYYVNSHVIMDILNIIVHLLCALSVSKDLGNFSRNKISPTLMSNFAWIVVSLATGILGLFIYWVMHHSSIAKNKK